VKTVGGTIASRICGLSKWGGPLSAYMELVAGTEAPRNSAMGRGTSLESSVLALWAEREGVFLLQGERKLLPAGMSYAHATLDALGLLSLEDGALVVAEAKTLAVEHAGDAWGEDGSDRVEPAYHLQGLWYLGVCRAAGLEVAPWVEMPVLVGPEAELAWAARLAERSDRTLTFEDLEGTGLSLRVYRLPWDEALFQEADARVRSFLAEHVEKGVPPAPSEGDVLMDRDRNAVARGFRAEKGRALDFEALPPVSQVAFQELLDATRQRRAWEEREEQAKTRVQLLLGSAEEVRGLPGGARVTWKSTKSGSRRFEIREPKG
jgi:hypothetical protein